MESDIPNTYTIVTIDNVVSNNNNFNKITDNILTNNIDTAQPKYGITLERSKSTTNMNNIHRTIQ